MWEVLCHVLALDYISVSESQSSSVCKLNQGNNFSNIFISTYII